VSGRPGRDVLCPCFRTLAEQVHKYISRGRPVDLIPGETSITDGILYKLATKHPSWIKVKRFNIPEEARNGADWEWWFRSGRRYIGMRVQAKLRNEAGQYGFKAKAPGVPREFQVDRLVKAASLDGLPAFYCLYSDQAIKTPTYERLGPCPHGEMDPRQATVSLILAETIRRKVHARENLNNHQIAAEALPWFRLVCTAADGDLVDGVSSFVAQARRQERSASYELARLWDEMPDSSGTEPPSRIVAAFEADSTEELDERGGLAGVVLFGVRGREVDG
jgi:hypothetical protein